MSSIAFRAGFSGDVEIWRRKRDQFQDYDQDAFGDKEYVAGALAGSEFHHKIYGAVVAPRTTQDLTTTQAINRGTYDGKTMYCDPTDDVRTDDLVVFTAYNGSQQVYIVEGEGHNDYVSPWTSVVGGKEVFLARVEVKHVDYT